MKLVMRPMTYREIVETILETVLDEDGKLDLLTTISILTDDPQFHYVCTALHNELCDEGDDLLNPSKE